ncbi:ankyrin repeat domain-containing protein [Propionivibrio sp.]|uniref:ankyrin repeat domain-containing protein n=1 Tax=Propionivibrio sp. TaxID=2212460 RepID=UPI0025F8FA35|nr:ankyrin repeat domain-containing protein [Propionivibrio sp.]
MINIRIWPMRDTEANMNHRYPTCHTDNTRPGPGSVWRLAVLLLIGALTLNIAACSKENDNNKQTQGDTPPVAESPLAKAVIQGDPGEIKGLLDAGAEIDSRDALGRTPLHMAAFYGHLKATEVLIGSGADINAKDRVGMTPLHAAVLSGGRREVEMLLSKNAGINIKSDDGQTALHLSAATGQPKLTKFLIERGADPKIKDANGKTPLSYAEQNNHPLTAAAIRQFVE